MPLPQVLTILTTNRCTAECDHCCMNSGPDRSETMEEATVTTVIKELHALSPLKAIVFAGGEPTLAMRSLRSGINCCHSLGIPSRMVTNASWATSYAKARKMLEKLRKWGLNELNISADDFHLPYIPFEYVVHVWKASKNMGFESVIIANSAAPNSLVTPGFIMARLSETLPLRFAENGQFQFGASGNSDGTFYGISNTRLQKLERAADRLPESMFQSIENIESIGGRCPHAVRSAALSPTGRLLSCCGFELVGNEVLDLGDTSEHVISDLIDGANNNPIIKGISNLGPVYMKEIVEQVAPEVKFPKNFGSMCEVCRSVVKNPRAVKALRQNIDLFLPAANAVAAEMEPNTG